MKTRVFSKLKFNILLRTHILNLLLLFFPPSNKCIIALSQNLDKYIVLYQKELATIHNSKQSKSNWVNNDIAA